MSGGRSALTESSDPPTVSEINASAYEEIGSSCISNNGLQITRTETEPYGPIIASGLSHAEKITTANQSPSGVSIVTPSRYGTLTIADDSLEIQIGKPNFSNFKVIDTNTALQHPPDTGDTTFIGQASGTTPSYWGAFWDEYWGGDSTTANRFAGLAQAAGGAAQTILGGSGIAAGAAGAPATGGASLGVTALSVIVTANGLDNVQAGVRQIWTGSPTQTATSSVVESVTGSRVAGEIVDAGIGIAGSAKLGKALTASKAAVHINWDGNFFPQNRQLQPTIAAPSVRLR